MCNVHVAKRYLDHIRFFELVVGLESVTAGKWKVRPAAQAVAAGADSDAVRATGRDGREGAKCTVDLSQLTRESAESASQLALINIYTSWPISEYDDVRVVSRRYLISNLYNPLEHMKGYLYCFYNTFHQFFSSWVLSWAHLYQPSENRN